MKRLLIALLAIALIAVRAALPGVRLDEISLALFAIVCLAILWPELGKLATGIRKFRLGELEVELSEKVEKLSERAEKAEEAGAKEILGKRVVEDIPPDVVKRISEAATDPRSALLLVAIEIEQAIRGLGRKYGLAEQASAGRLIAQLAEQGYVLQDVVPLFRDFWQVRNQVIHQAGFNIPAGQIYTLVDVGLTILKLLSTQIITPGGIESGESFGTPTIR